MTGNGKISILIPTITGLTVTLKDRFEIHDILILIHMLASGVLVVYVNTIGRKMNFVGN